ncbi:hypothetical protein [Rhodanobacter thiooxydans]|uniref:hypothetical protein n=1 Tax=Rhodanobacter thiooxydans TaxID=416169 RepID=UPI001F43C8B7|nr:hypothetical protein [Rhodanobacter thiooxydans]
MNPSDLTASLYFTAAVRVAADASLTRLLPLDALQNLLAPHEHFSHRILLSLQALGVIEPELSLAHADDWLLSRDWMKYGFDSVAWRIRWTPGDCRRRHDIANEIWSDVDFDDDESLSALLALWEDLALAEVAQYTGWLLSKSGYNPDWTYCAIDALRHALEIFSVNQVMYLVYLSVRSVATTHQLGGVESARLGLVFASSVTSFSGRANAEGWNIRGMTRPAELSMSSISLIFAHEVTRLDDEYFAKSPSLELLRGSMTRHRTLH